jgi:hypothetical protein
MRAPARGDNSHARAAMSWEPPPPAPTPPPSTRARVALAAGIVVALAGVAVIAAVVAHFADRGNGALPASSIPGIPSPGNACLDTTQAKAVWTDITKRLDALSLHPDVAHVGDVAEGTAATEIRQYLQQTLIDKHLTERERERLDNLSVIEDGCDGLPLTVHVTETLVQDDYLAPDGHVDHVDSQVGQQLESVDSYVRSGSTWKVVAITSLAQPTPQGNTV